MTERKRPLVLGQRCRHLDGREGQLMAWTQVAREDAPANSWWVEFDDGTNGWLLAGYLEALSADKLTA